MRAHFDGGEEFGVRSEVHDALKGLGVHVVAVPVFVEPSGEAVGFVIGAVPLGSQILKGQVCHAVRRTVLGCLGVAIGAKG